MASSDFAAVLNSDRVKGIIERVLYSLFFFGAMKMVEFQWIDVTDAAYVAAGGVAAVGSLRAWIINRPSALMNSASAQIPANSKLVIETLPHASSEERKQATELAIASNEKVTAKTTPNGGL